MHNENHTADHDTAARPGWIFCFCSGDPSSCWVVRIIALTVLLVGLWTAKQSGEAADLQMRRELVQQVTSIAAAVNPTEIRTLSFTAEDKNRPTFRRLCSQMAAYADATGLRSLYTMSLRDGQIVFGPESLPEGHPYASPPGTVYQMPTTKDFEIFQTARPQIQGPTHDEYGMFVTASAPVIDPVTGDVLAAIGIDVEAAKWQAAVRQAQWFPGGITLCLLLILFGSGLILQMRGSVTSTGGISRHTETILCVVFMGALSLSTALYFHHMDRNVRENTFYSLAQVQAAVSVSDFHDLHTELEQMGCFFEASETVSRDEFSTYCKKLLQTSVMRSCLWIPAVPANDAEPFVQTVRSAGVPEFFIWQTDRDGTKEPVSSRPVYYPVLYTEPPERAAVLGYDENSEPFRSAAIQGALSTGLNTSTDPVRPVLSTNSTQAFLVFKPVRAAVQTGVVAFVVSPEKLLSFSSFGRGISRDLNICLAQLQRGKEPVLMAYSSPQCGPDCWKAQKSGLSVDVPIFRFGKAYALRIIPDQKWLAAHPLNTGWRAGIIGLILTFLTSLVVGLIVNRRHALERLVNRRTAELKSSEELYQRLAQHLEIVREEERKRLSRELHDDIGQILTALKIDLMLVHDRCTCGSEVRNKMDDMQRLLSEGIQSVHSLCHRLRPGALDDLGLDEALSALAGDWKIRNGIECVLFADIEDVVMPDDLKTTVFRMVQEALTNVSRHAQASCVEINLVADQETLTVSIADNGCGMEPGAAAKAASFGLLGMRERIEVLGGTLCIHSSPGKGTRIEGIIPLAKRDAE